MHFIGGTVTDTESLREWTLVVRGNSEDESTWHWEVIGPKAYAYHDDIVVQEKANQCETAPSTNPNWKPITETKHYDPEMKNKYVCDHCGQEIRSAPTNPAMPKQREDAAEKYEREVERKHGSHWDCCYHSDTVEDAFKAGWDARDEEVRRLKENHEKWCPHFHDKYQEMKSENKRLREALERLEWIVNNAMDDECSVQIKMAFSEIRREALKANDG